MGELQITQGLAVGAGLRVACFALSAVSHFNGALAVAESLIEAGAKVRIWTDQRNREQVHAAGIEFSDLFEFGPVEEIDSISIPHTSRMIAYSVRHCEALARIVEAWQPDVIFVEGFALVGRLIAERISKPWVLINSGHLSNGPLLRSFFRQDFPARFSDACLQAVERLKTEFGHEDASPYSYICSPSPWANIHLEPPEWLVSDPDNLSPHIECFGSYVPVLEPARSVAARSSAVRIYAAFGTIIWRSWTRETLRVFERLVDAVHQLPSACLTIGLGGAGIDREALKRLGRERITLMPYANQIEELRSHDLFVTHNGLNSTHEAVMLQIPMVSCPFFGDQPDLARLCEAFGISRRIADRAVHTDALPSAEQFVDSICTVLAQRDLAIENLRKVREWQIDAIRNRPSTIRRVLSRF